MCCCEIGRYFWFKVVSLECKESESLSFYMFLRCWFRQSYLFPHLFQLQQPAQYLLDGGFKHFFFHHYLGKIPILTNIFQVGWNHQLGLQLPYFPTASPVSVFLVFGVPRYWASVLVGQWRALRMLGCPSRGDGVLDGFGQPTGTGGRNGVKIRPRKLTWNLKMNP